MRFVGLDPATITGFVALDQNGNVLVAKDIKAKGSGPMEDDKLANLGHLLYHELQDGDEILFEDANPRTQKPITTGMIHGILRYMINRKGLIPNLLSPTAVKKYIAVTGWKGDSGSKVRLKGPEVKAAVKKACLEQFGFTHKSDNVIDAYVIARASWNLYLQREFKPIIDNKPNQIEVIESILQKREVVGK